MTDFSRPAFPITEASPHHGMTMRQYYKAMALQGLLCGQYRESSLFNLADVPQEAGRIADAMLAEDEAHESRET